MKKVLVSGGLGFVASYLINRLNDLNFKVDTFTIDDDPLKLQDNEYDYIFHLASIARTNECLDDGLNLAYKSNVELTRLLLDNFKFKNFIYDYLTSMPATSTTIEHSTRSNFTSSIEFVTDSPFLFLNIAK